MYISLNWLKDFIKLPAKIGVEEIANALTDHTVEIEGYTKQAEQFEKVVVGKVLSVEKHPNADRLRLAVVDVKSEKLNIVCGAPNLEVGQLVPVALIGAVLPGGLEIKESEIRGEKSCGMICAEDELGIGKSHDGIIVLDPKKAKPGQDFSAYLEADDTIFEVDNKSLSNRSDLLSHYGLARELSAIFEAPLKPYSDFLSPDLSFPEGREAKLEVKIEDIKACPRYLAVRVDNIKVEESPAWLKKRLVAIGQKPINNIVDLTNYVMLESGQPLHAFDSSLVSKIVVRRAHQGETIETLDEKERLLDKDDLVISDGREAIAVAGIMGGQKSGISLETTGIILESANFQAAAIRKTSQKLGLRTDASTRFEKALDPALAETAMMRILTVLLQVCPQAAINSVLVDIDHSDKTAKTIKLPLAWLNQKIGQEIPRAKVISSLRNLGFGVGADQEEELEVLIPSWRAAKDVAIKEDLVEEVLRIYGYNNIDSQLPVETLSLPERNEERLLERRLKAFLASKFGLFEVYNYSFVGSEQLKRLNIDFFNHLKLANPLSEVHNVLRQSLVPNLSLNIKNNQAKAEALGFFEFGSVFFNAPGDLSCGPESDETLPYQEKRLGLVLAGSGVDVFNQAKGQVASLLQELFGLEAEPVFSVVEEVPGWADQRYCTRVFFRGEDLGVVALMSKEVAANLNLKKEAAFAELNFDSLAKLAQAAAPLYREPARYPSLVRDLAFVVDEKILYNEIKGEIKNFDNLIEEVELFDAYSGNKLESGLKSLAFHLSFRAEDRTLQTEEVEALIAKLLSHLENRFDAKLRD